MLGDHIDALGIQIDRLTSRIQELIGAIPAAQPPGDGAGPSGAGTTAATTGTQDTDQPLTPTPNPTPLGALQRLDEVPGIGGKAAQVLIAELGLDMGQFPTPAQLVSWARLAPRTIQSGAKRRAGTTGKANPYLKGRARRGRRRGRQDRHLPLGERYRRLVRRIGKLKALVAVARSILVIVWHLLADPTPASTTWAPTTTPAASTPTARPAPTSASSRPWATPSP
jgi:transposase